MYVCMFTHLHIQLSVFGELVLEYAYTHRHTDIYTLPIDIKLHRLSNPYQIA